MAQGVEVSNVKRCSSCRETMPVSSFGKNKARYDGLSHACKDCRRQFYAANGEKMRQERRASYRRNDSPAKEYAIRAHFAKKYGLTLEQRDSQISAQGDECPLCGVRLSSIPPKQVHVDHCHATGDLRGVLCHACNVTLYRMESSEGWADRAADYLSKGGIWNTEASCKHE